MKHAGLDIHSVEAHKLATALTGAVVDIDDIWSDAANQLIVEKAKSIYANDSRGRSFKTIEGVVFRGTSSELAVQHKLEEAGLSASLNSERETKTYTWDVETKIDESVIHIEVKSMLRVSKSGNIRSNFSIFVDEEVNPDLIIGSLRNHWRERDFVVAVMVEESPLNGWTFRPWMLIDSFAFAPENDFFKVEHHPGSWLFKNKVAKHLCKILHPYGKT